MFKGLEWIGYAILIVAFIICLFEHGIVMFLLPVAVVVILFLLLCGCKF